MNFTLAFKGFSPEVTRINTFHTSSVKQVMASCLNLKGRVGTILLHP